MPEPEPERDSAGGAGQAVERAGRSAVRDRADQVDGAEQRVAERWADLYVDVLNTSLERGQRSARVSTLTGALAFAGPVSLLLAGALLISDASVGTPSIGAFGIRKRGISGRVREGVVSLSFERARGLTLDERHVFGRVEAPVPRESLGSLPCPAADAWPERAERRASAAARHQAMGVSRPDRPRETPFKS